MTRVNSPASMPRPLAMVMTATSRWATWEISWARTASISGSSSRRSKPEVAQTTAALGLRPVAKALGTSVSAMATRGLGMSASAHRRSITPCSSGACSGVTSLACMANMAILSLKKYWQKSSPKPMTRMSNRLFKKMKRTPISTA